jgi:Domain of unknown function (DUF1707)
VRRVRYLVVVHRKHGLRAAVSEPERSRALIRLRDRYAADNLSIEAFSHALDAVLGARTQGELEQASPDLAFPLAVSDLSWRDAESLEHHLPPGEAILWAGRPVVGFALPNPRATFKVGLVAAWAFVVFLGNLVSQGSVTAVVGATGVCLVVLYVVSRRYLFTSRRRRRILYLVTTARVARVVRGRSGEQMDSMLISAISGLSVNTRGGGRGTISFGQPAPDASVNSGFSSRNARQSEDNVLSFANVPDSVDVARLIGSLQAHQAKWRDPPAEPSAWVPTARPA